MFISPLISSSFKNVFYIFTLRLFLHFLSMQFIVIVRSRKCETSVWKLFHHILLLKKASFYYQYDSRKKLYVQLLISVTWIIRIAWIARFIDIRCLFMTCFFSVIAVLLFVFFIVILCFII